MKTKMRGATEGRTPGGSPGGLPGGLPGGSRYDLPGGSGITPAGVPLENGQPALHPEQVQFGLESGLHTPPRPETGPHTGLTERGPGRAWLVAVLDRANLRIYRMERAGRWPRLGLVAAQVFPDARLPDREVYSGEPGAFAPAGQLSPAGRSPGRTGFHRRQGSMPERHLELEAGRRVARVLGRRLNAWMGQLRPVRWCLAVPGVLEAGVLGELDPGVRGRLLEVVPRNLVRVLQTDLPRHFPRLGLWLAQGGRGGAKGR